MANFTPNYNLRKPVGTEQFDIDRDFNANWDVIDGELKEQETIIENLEIDEVTRETNETARKAAEAARVSAETSRGTAEQGRTTAETGRVNAETARVTAEQGRISEETARVNAETARSAFYAGFNAQLNENTQKINSLDYSKLKTDGSVIANIKNEIVNGNFTSLSGWAGSNASLSVNSNRMTVVATGANKSASAIRVQTKALTTGQRVYYRLFVRVTNPDCLTITGTVSGGHISRSILNPEANKWYLLEHIGTAPTYTGNILLVTHEYADAAAANGKIMEIEKVMYIDLIDDFGLGSNPQLNDVKKVYDLNNLDFWDGTQKLIVKNELKDIDSKITKVKEDSNFKTVHHEIRRPVVSFVNDDGWEADYYKLKGFSETYGVPFTSALIANASTLKQDQVLYLQNELGWEIASHTANHVVLPTLTTEAEIENELKTSKEILESRGYQVYNLVYPQGESDERVRRIAKKYYNCAATTLSGINTGVCPSFYLKRFPMGSFISGTYEIYKEQVDLAVAQNGWLIFMLHPNNASHNAQQQTYIEQTIQYIKSLNIEVLTLNDGYKIFGNALEVGDFIGGTGGLAISKTGERKNI